MTDTSPASVSMDVAELRELLQGRLLAGFTTQGVIFRNFGSFLSKAIVSMVG